MTPNGRARWWLVERKCCPIPIPYGEKAPTLPDWQNLDESNVDQYFNGDRQNVGILVGTQVGEYTLADFDLDVEEARWAWMEVGLDTQLIFGRKSNPASHQLILTDQPVRTMQFDDPLPPEGKKARLLELRGTNSKGKPGLQTVVPDSTHPSGETYEFVKAGHPSLHKKAAAEAAARHTAAVVLARHLKEGTRHAAFLALAGAMVRSGWHLERAALLIRAVYRVLWHEHADVHAAEKEAETTFEKFHRGEETTGLRTLNGFLPQPVYRKIAQWLGLKTDAGEEGARAEAPQDWPDPKPLQGELPPVRVFDPALLPESLRGHAIDVSERMQVPLDFVAAFEVLCLAGTVNRRATIQPKAIDNSWVVTPNLWGGCVADSGLKKSPTLKAVVHPLEKMQAKWHQDYASELENYERDKEEQELRQAAWKEQYKAARKAGKSEPIRPDDTLPELKLRRIILNDATYEKLHEVMADNPSGVLVVRDELTGWLAQLERQGREGEREFSLQAWNGDTGHAIDRIGRGTLYVPHCCMSLMGGIQPDRLRSYLADVMAGGPTNDGLMQRFQVLVWPDVSRNPIYMDRLPDFDAEQRVAHVFQTLVEMDAETAECLRFAEDAQELFVAWFLDLETRLASGELHGALASHLSKFRSLMPTLALLFEWADAAANGQTPTCVSLAHARQAAAWCDYLESHARRVYSCIVTPQFRAAQVLSEKIKQKKVGIDGIFSVREVYLKGWSGLDTPEAAKAAADVLEDAGWVRSPENESPDPFRRGRPANRYQINPKVWS